MIDNPPDPTQRIRRPDLLATLLRWAADECALGEISRHRVSDVGYDDCNVILETASGHYVVKVFNSARSSAQSARYVDVIERVIAAGVHHPRLASPHGRALLHHVQSGNHLIVMEFVAGSTFLDLDTYPRPDEVAVVVDQIQRIHSVDLVPEYVHDWWAIPNIADLVREVSPVLPADDRRYVAAAAEALGEVEVAALPHALVHGDLTKANVMRCAGTAVAILDFAVANWYPRIHELAMVAVNLMHGDPLPIQARIEMLTELYARRAALTAAEREAFPRYVFAAAAMELLGAAREWSLKGNHSYETGYLLELGRAAVRAAVC